MKFLWETVSKGYFRAKVFGGWVLHSSRYEYESDMNVSISESMVFIPDPRHEWVIDNKGD